MKRTNVIAGLALCYLVVLVLVAVGAPLLTKYTYDQQDLSGRFLQSNKAHWLGTDNLGRDNASRLFFGARVSLVVGLTVVSATLIFGGIVGVIAAMRGGWVDTLLMRVTDGLFAFPDILLAILIVGVAGRSSLTVIAALTVVGWPSMARLVRGQTLSLREALFVRAAQATGASQPHIVFKHLVPHLAGICLAAAIVDMASVILAESALSFLGIGIPPPAPSWGSLVSTGREFMRTDWHLVLYPCLALALTIICLNLVGDALFERWDPRKSARA